MNSINWYTLLKRCSVAILLFACTVLLGSPTRQILARSPEAKTEYTCNDPANGLYIRLLSWEFDPLCQPEPIDLPDSLHIWAYPETQAGYYLVQFQGPILAEWKQTTITAGAQLYDYIPDFTFVARMDLAAYNQVTKLPFVRWVGVYQPAYRLSPILRADLFQNKTNGNAQIGVRVSFFPHDDQTALTQQIRTISNITSDYRSSIGAVVQVDTQISDLITLARLNEVRWIEPVPKWELNNSVAADIMSVRTIWNTHGLYGQGQIIGIADTGLDQGSTDPAHLHDDFENGAGVSRVLQIFDWVGDGANDVNSGHGTHTAGSILGNGFRSGSTPTTHTYPSTSFAGMAPEASLVFQSVEQNSTGYLTGLPADLNTLFLQAYNAGARIHSNSWGSAEAGQYTIDSQNADLFLWNHPDFSILFSAGNEGTDINTANGVIDLLSLGSPASAKNVITVGASENNRSSGGYNPGGACSLWGNCWPSDYGVAPISTDPLSNNPQGMAAFSSRGPTVDGRYKPDIVAPGTNILSTKSSATSSTGWGPYNTYYMYMGGTSMSTPLTAGATTLIRQYFTNLGLTPSGSLIKATLLNGASDLYPGQYGTGTTREQPNTRPNNVEGWGRVNIENSLFPTAPAVLDYFDFAQGLQTNEYDSFTFNLSNTSAPFKTTLAWTDYPGSLAAGGALVNDLDLHVVDASSVTHYPLNANPRTGTLMGANDTDPYNAYNSSTNYRYAMRFIPSSYPVTVEKALLFIYSASYPVNFQLWVYDNSGTGGNPGNILYGPQTFKATSPGWISVFITGVTINSGGFYIAWGPTASNPAYVITDIAAGGGTNRYYNGSTWRNWTNPDLSIRAVMAKPNATTSYDRVNNVEGVDIAPPPGVGDYTVKVAGYNVANGPQPYALATSGAINLKGAASYRLFGSGDVASRTFGRTGLDIDFTSGPGGNISVTMVKTATSHPPANGPYIVNRTWTITPSFTGFSATLVFHYDESDLPSGMTEDMISSALRWNPSTSTWEYYLGTRDTNANTLTVTGVSAFSEWIIGSNNPTAVTFASLLAIPGPGSIEIAWRTVMETNLLGFNIYRAESPDGRRTLVNTAIIPSKNPGGINGAEYSYLDLTTQPGVMYYYWIQVVELDGMNWAGPVEASANWPIYLPILLKH
jgi:hypothetical protein